MGRLRGVDGSPTELITLRLPTWLLDRAKEVARLENIPAREVLRDILMARFTQGSERRGEDSFGE